MTIYVKGDSFHSLACASLHLLFHPHNISLPSLSYYFLLFPAHLAHLFFFSFFLFSFFRLFFSLLYFFHSFLLLFIILVFIFFLHILFILFLLVLFFSFHLLATFLLYVFFFFISFTYFPLFNLSHLYASLSFCNFLFLFSFLSQFLFSFPTFSLLFETLPLPTFTNSINILFVTLLASHFLCLLPPFPSHFLIGVSSVKRLVGQLSQQVT